MSKYLLIDFGSTYTKVIAVDLEKEMVLGTAQAPTTINTDITIGMNNAISNLESTCNIDMSKIHGKYASSSAAGGLKMVAIGLVPELTLEAARRAALGAGAKLISGYGFEIDYAVIEEIESAQCDIVLLSGGTDGGNKKVIIHNAQMLANSNVACPILVAGNKSASMQVKKILEEKGKIVYTTQNVLPSLDVVNVEPAQKIIREIFIAHIIQAKGLSKAQKYIGKEIIPTPKASLLAATLLADGANEEPGLGSLLVVEIGGATTNIHSVADNQPVTPQTILKGLPESRAKRTVEGDLGIRYNAKTIFDLVGGVDLQQIAQALLSSQECEYKDIEQYVQNISNHVDYKPSSNLELNLDIALAKSAVAIATERHVGKLKQDYYPSLGEITVQYGKNLLNVQNVIGTGGVFKHGLQPQRILHSALFDPEKPWILKPKNPNLYLDKDYILYGIGLLSQDFPQQALRIAKKYLKQYNLN